MGIISANVEQSVLDWYNEKWNAPILFSKNKPVISLETSLSTGKYPWTREAGDETMKDYFDKFSVNADNFNFLRYWPYEKGIIPNFLRPKSMRITKQEPEPLTIRMLVESAKAGRWLYD
ncbi:DUF1493 family protein [Serratia sp. UGAL515B_01]|uniref:DUF1493 family protein n=1 Tax=Serratia sp. UGAL515B_01 TaxID=2986763 RepID=UPI0029544139|nr:DUF1493 family protein [Serratia sp. UGAL515B_01]WON78427.1 DUF1493 family protein [Serratia sp. UGAL515B_01]